MARYRKIDTRIWNDAKVRLLSDDAQLVFLFCLTHPNLTAIGAMRATLPGLAAERGWDLERFRDAIQALVDAGMLLIDEDAACLAFPNFLRYNPPESPNVVRAWQSCLDLIPECDLHRRIVQSARAHALSRGHAFAKAFREAFGEGYAEGYREAFREGLPEGYREGLPEGYGEGYREGLPEGLPEALPKGLGEPLPEALPPPLPKGSSVIPDRVPDHPSPNQEQEQEQEQEQDLLLAATKTKHQASSVDFDAAAGVFRITEEKRDFLQEKFPSLDLASELRRMEAWLVANPGRLRASPERFIVNWLSRSAERRAADNRPRHPPDAPRRDRTGAPAPGPRETELRDTLVDGKLMRELYDVRTGAVLKIFPHPFQKEKEASP